MKEVNVNKIRTVEELDEYVDGLNLSCLMFDTESYSLEYKSPLFGISMYDRVKNPCFIYIENPYFGGVSLKDARRILNPIFKVAKTVAHNAKYDLLVLKAFDFVDPKIIFDTMLAVHAFDPEMRKNLEFRLAEDFGWKKEKFEDMVARVTGVRKRKWPGIDWTNSTVVDLLGQYSGEDVYGTNMLYDLYRKRLKDTNTMSILEKIELPLCYVLRDMKATGVLIDVPLLKDMDIELDEELDAAKEGIYAEAECRFNLNSPKQKAKVLYDQLGYTCPGLTKKGGRSTDKDALMVLSNEGAVVADLMLEYSVLNKLSTGYVKGIPELVYPDGRLRADFNSEGARCITGESIVVTEEGMFPIKNTNKHTVVVNKDLKLEEALEFHSFKHENTYRVKTKLGYSVEGNSLHQIVCARRIGKEWEEYWRPVGVIEEGEYVKVPFGYNVFAKSYKRTAWDVVSTYHTTKLIRTPKVIDEDLAELIGMFNADGSIHDGNDSFSIRISNRRLEVSERVKRLSMKLFNLVATYSEIGECTSLTTVNLSPIVEVFDLQRTCHDKVVPQIIMESPRSVVVAYIKGLLLDSHVYNDRNKSYLQITLSNEKHALQIHIILLNMGYPSSYTSCQNSHFITLYNEKAYEFLKEVRPCKILKDVTKKTTRARRYPVMDGYVLLKVESKEFFEDKIVYDYHLPRTHSFIANGIVNHNTGRMSSSNPNLQNQPNNVKFPVRDSFIPADGMKLLVADWSQIELRIMAHCSRDPRFVKAFTDGLDIHGYVANDLGISRKHAKVVNFGVLYGMGPRALSLFLGVDEKAAAEIIDGYHRTYRGYDVWKEQTEKFAKRNGYVRNIFGRIRRLPEAQSKGNWKAFYAALRQAVNTMIQGSAADLMKLNLIEMHRQFASKKLGVNMLLVVHDEFVAEAPVTLPGRLYHLEECYDLVCNIMENYVKLSIPVIADGKVCDCWGDMKNDNYISLLDRPKITVFDMMDWGLL